MLVLLIIALTFAFVWYKYIRTQYVTESPESVAAGTAIIADSTSNITTLIKINEMNLHELAISINNAKTRAGSDASYQVVVNILLAEYALIEAKNEQLKTLQLENQELAYDAGVNIVTSGFRTEKLAAGKSNVEARTRTTDVPTREVNVEINKKNTSDVKRQELVKKINKKIKVKNTKSSLEDINTERKAKGRPEITVEKQKERKQKLEVRKEVHRQLKEQVKELRNAFKSEKDPVLRRTLKADFLAAVHQLKNSGKKNKQNEKEINDDNKVLAAGVGGRDTVPVTGSADVAAANEKVANNIDAEITIKETIITDAVKAVNTGTPANAIISDLESKIDLSVELTAEENALIAEVGL